MLYPTGHTILPLLCRHIFTLGEIAGHHIAMFCMKKSHTCLETMFGEISKTTCPFNTNSMFKAMLTIHRPKQYSLFTKSFLFALVELVNLFPVQFLCLSVLFPSLCPVELSLLSQGE